ncbi:torsin-1A-like [Hydra vulgaris]|uniref:Torsin-1A-like n=1 Tax=Hydra vulgaris TaxID=6087 RepID=A0ABM4D5Q8_HYDVU
MNSKLNWIIILISLVSVHTFEPITTAVKIYCQFIECCDDDWINHNVSGIQDSLKEKLFGQHLVIKMVGKTVESHSKIKTPKKPLVMSFQGWTGSGKSFVSDIVAQHLYKNGLNSKFVHKKIAAIHYKHKSDLEKYKIELTNFIETNTKKCERSLFIFDEVDKFPEGLADVLKPYLDFHHALEGTDYRKNIFIFLSNTAADRINNFAIKHFADGKSREMITSFEMEKLLSVSAFNIPGGFKNADIVLEGLIDFYVPFLPLERKHVKQCAEAELQKRYHKHDDAIIEETANEIQYFPEEGKWFSATGCKTISNKVSMFVN